ncbi:MAG: hypothetical protein HQK83_09020 [Fibrobacteria bacterium]|nr:hypothetical protein [Fibrobacteria bacterium]
MKMELTSRNGRVASEIWETYSKDLKKYVETRTHDLSRVENILQEIIMEVYLDADSFMTEEHPLLVLYRKARSVMLKDYCDYDEIEDLIEELPEMEEDKKNIQITTGILLPVLLSKS